MAAPQDSEFYLRDLPLGILPWFPQESRFASPPSPQSQSFSRSYGSNLPNSLIYILLVDQRLLTLETWCGCGYDLARNKYLTRIFKGHHERTWQSEKLIALPVSRPYLWIIQFHGVGQLRRKENSSRGTHWRLRARLCCHTESVTSLRNINLIPFRRRGVNPLYEHLRLALGSSNSWPISVLMKPFSTLAFKILIWIIATTTKICTRRSSTSLHSSASTLRLRPPTLHARFSVKAKYRCRNIAPSIFRAHSFGRWAKGIP